jgi:hypothetical protein
MKRLICGTIGFFALLLASGCAPGEGDRCNPLLFSDECGGGLQCTVPQNCAVAYCCPTNSEPVTVANCQACPVPDAGGSD